MIMIIMLLIWTLHRYQFCNSAELKTEEEEATYVVGPGIYSG